jgi:23S rRNA pseudouridine2605 synthase
VKERIQKVLANYGVDSRRNIEQMILQGRISVNGRVVARLPVMIDPETDRVTVDGESVRLAKTRKGAAPVQKLYFLLNKPKGVYSTNVAQGEQRLAKDLLPPDIPGRVYPVGQLDADSKGLLLLTNDGELTNLLTHPRYEVPRTYRVVVDGKVSPAAIKALTEGVWLADREGKGFKSAKSKVKTIHTTSRESVLEITIGQGRDRQVQRVLAKMGHKVRELMRVKLGHLTLHGVGSGSFRPLTAREVKQLYTLAGEAKPRYADKPVAAKAAATKPSAKKPAAARKTAAKKPARQADAGKDLAVEFEDDELIREAAGEDAGGSGAVDFVELSESEQQELEVEAKAAAAKAIDHDDDDELPE